jgi:hypothetical protein
MAVSWEKAIRSVSLAAPATTWTALLAEIDALPPEDRFAVELDGRAERELALHLVGSLIASGYSVGTSSPRLLVPRPSGVLAIVSQSDGEDDVAPRIPRPGAGHFRRHLMAVDTSETAFARLASTCAGESWHLDSFLPQNAWAQCIVEYVGSREIDLVQVVNSRFGVDLIPALRAAYPATRVVVDIGSTPQAEAWLTYVTARYGNVVDGFCVSRPDEVATLTAERVSPDRIWVVDPGGGEQVHPGAAEREQVYGRLIATLAA